MSERKTPVFECGLLAGENPEEPRAGCGFPESVAEHRLEGPDGVGVRNEGQRGFGEKNVPVLGKEGDDSHTQKELISA